MRLLVSLAVQGRMGPFFPYGTLAVNLLCSFALGFLFASRERSLHVSPDLWLFLGTGLCGGFTTMSTFSFETLALVRERELYYAGLNVAATLAGASSVIHTEKLLEMSSDLPVLIEVVDARERIEGVLARLDDLVRDTGVLMTLENVRVIRYEKESA